MSDELLNSLISRIERVEAIAGSHSTPPDRGEEIKALRDQLTAVKAELRNREIEVKDLRTIVASKVTRADVVAVLNKNIPALVEVIGDVTGDVMVKSEKTLRTEIGDATRAISREAEAAHAAASASIKSASAVIGAWASELGA